MWLIDLSWEYQTHCHQQLNKESIALQHLQHHFCCTTATLRYKRASAAFATLVSFVDISIAAFIHKIEKATLLFFGIMHFRNLISFALSSFQTISFLCTYIFHIPIIISFLRYRVKNIGRSEQCPKHLRFEAMMVYSLFYNPVWVYIFGCVCSNCCWDLFDGCFPHRPSAPRCVPNLSCLMIITGAQKCIQTSCKHANRCLSFDQCILLASTHNKAHNCDESYPSRLGHLFLCSQWLWGFGKVWRKKPELV